MRHFVRVQVCPPGLPNTIEVVENAIEEAAVAQFSTEEEAEQFIQSKEVQNS